MKALFALILLVGFMVLGVWLGLFVMLIPGLTEIIHQCQTEIVPDSFAIAIIKTALAWPVAVFCFGFGASFHKEIMKP